MKAGNLIRNCFFAPVFQPYINNPLGLKSVLGAMHIKIIYKGPSQISTPGTPWRNVSKFGLFLDQEVLTCSLKEAECLYHIYSWKAEIIRVISKYADKCKRYPHVLNIKYNCIVLFLDKGIDCLFMIENRISHGPPL